VTGAGAYGGDPLAQIAHALHDMCQPLTVLQCRLEIDLLEAESATTEVKQAAEACMRECERLSERVGTIRAIVQQVIAERLRDEQLQHPNLIPQAGVNQG